MKKFAAVVLLALASAAPAGATELWSATPSAPCDFFQAELIGEYCARTAFIGVYGDENVRTLTQTFPSPPFNPATQPSARNTYRQSDEGATLALSPWQGVRITLQDEAVQTNNTYGFIEQFPQQNVNFYSPALQRSASGAGFLDVGADVTLWDRQQGAFRSIFSLFGHLGAMPASGVGPTQDRQELGWSSGLRWNFGPPGLSLDYFSQTYLRRFDNPNEVQLLSTSRLMLDSASLGVAAGPELLTINELGHDPSLKIGWNSTALGGRVIAEPFRALHTPVLSDITVEGYGRYYIGQAELVANYVGVSRAYEFGGSARLNFRF